MLFPLRDDVVDVSDVRDEDDRRCRSGAEGEKSEFCCCAGARLSRLIPAAIAMDVCTHRRNGDEWMAIRRRRSRRW